MKSQQFYEKYHMAFPMREVTEGKLEVAALGEGQWFPLTEDGEFTREGIKVLGSLYKAVVKPGRKNIVETLNRMEADVDSEESKEFMGFRHFQLSLYEQFTQDYMSLTTKFEWNPDELAPLN